MAPDDTVETLNLAKSKKSLEWSLILLRNTMLQRSGVLVHSLPLAGHVIIRNSNSIFGKTPDGMRQSSAEGWAVVLEAAGSCDYSHGCG